MIKILSVLMYNIEFTCISAEKNVSTFANAKATHIFFRKNIRVYAIFNDQSFNDTLTNDIVSFQQLSHGQLKFTEHRIDSIRIYFHVKWFQIFCLFLKYLLHAFMAEMIKINYYNSGNSVVDISKIVCFGWLL